MLLKKTLLAVLAAIFVCVMLMAQQVSPMPSTLMSGLGSPIGTFTCDGTLSTATTTAVYIQRDAAASQAMWTCQLLSDGSTYQWVQRPPIAKFVQGRATTTSGGLFTFDTSSASFTSATSYSCNIQPDSVALNNSVTDAPIKRNDLQTANSISGYVNRTLTVAVLVITFAPAGVALDVNCQGN